MGVRCLRQFTLYTIAADIQEHAGLVIKYKLMHSKIDTGYEQTRSVKKESEV